MKFKACIKNNMVVDSNYPCLIIAEVGECWNGDKEQAKKLIRVAAEAGCDYVKFQTLDKNTLNDDDPERDWFIKIALTDEMIAFLIDYARKNKIRPLFTPPNIEKARLLKEKFRLNEVKIASSVSYNNDTVTYIAENFRKVFLSTGMNLLDDVRSTVRRFNKKNNELYLLHTISEYPTGPLLKKRGLVSLAEKDVRLNMMLILGRAFPRYKIGYSDHTAGLLAPVCAVAAGAKVIEKHITLDRDKPTALYKSGKGYLGTDHIFSLEPDELKEMVKKIRGIEKIFGEYKWKRTEAENISKAFLIGRF